MVGRLYWSELSSTLLNLDFKKKGKKLFKFILYLITSNLLYIFLISYNWKLIGVLTWNLLGRYNLNFEDVEVPQ